MSGRPFVPLTERIRRNSQPAEGCWIWRSKRDREGYGLIELRVPGQGRASRHWRVAHVVAYEAFVGSVPAGLQLDHRCRNRACVNPGHLEPVTGSVNMLRAAPHNRITRCARGHEFTPVNTRTRGNRRICRACDRIRSASYRTKGGST